MPAEVVIAGHLTIDDIHMPDGRLLPETIGGAIAYAAVGAVMYGARVQLISLVGSDYPIRTFLDRISPYGAVNASCVRVKAVRSIHNDAWYRADGVRKFDIESWEVLEDLTPTAEDIGDKTVHGGHVLLTAGSVSKQGDNVQYARGMGCIVAMDTEIHYFPDPQQQEVLRGSVAASNYFLPSIEHLQLLFNSHSREVECYTDGLASLGCPWIAVKRGSQGCTLLDCNHRRSYMIPCVSGVHDVDPTGAGDTFDGGFVGALADGKDPLSAACWGTACASFGIESIGAMVPETFDRETASQRYAEVSNGVEEASWET
jgi:sugar/nucleoside kinase (ribokinase family)